jgi:hypothetical protein
VRRPSVQLNDIIWTRLVTEHYMYMLHAIFRPGARQRVIRWRQSVSRIRWQRRQRASK